jgi:hypothetical protein
MVFDFSAARMKHLNWRMRLQLFIEDPTSARDSEFVSEHDCQLGKWLDGRGGAKWGHLPTMKQLVQVHAAVHRLARSIVQEAKAGASVEARRLFASLSPQTDEVVGLLNKLESEVAPK